VLEIYEFFLGGGGVNVQKFGDLCRPIFHSCLYSVSHSRVAPENVGLQKEENYSTFACHTCNEMLLCFLGIRKKEVGNMKI
jgi:hypothetical protein